MFTNGSDLASHGNNSEGTSWNADTPSSKMTRATYNFFPQLCSVNSTRVDRQSEFQETCCGLPFAICHLPFTDPSPWFLRGNHDTLKALQLLGSYIGIVRPTVVLIRRTTNLCSYEESWGTQYHSQRFIGTLGNQHSSDDFSSRSAFPCMFPLVSIRQQSRCSHRGGFIFVSKMFEQPDSINKGKSCSYLILASTVAWYAMSSALAIAAKRMPTSRKDCVRLIRRMRGVSGPDTKFGGISSQVMQEFANCRQT